MPCSPQRQGCFDKKAAKDDNGVFSCLAMYRQDSSCFTEDEGNQDQMTMDTVYIYIQIYTQSATILTMNENSQNNKKTVKKKKKKNARRGIFFTRTSIQKA